jgi:hypothetical protein
MVAHVRYSVARQLRDRVTPCAICTRHEETWSTGFLDEPQNQGRWFVSGLASKPLGWFLPVWPQNRWRRFLQFGLKTGVDGFSRFCLKTGGDSFSGLALKPVSTVSPGLA